MKTKSQIEKEMIIQEIEDEIRRAANRSALPRRRFAENCKPLTSNTERIAT